jgi:hypothetical protein
MRIFGKVLQGVAAAGFGTALLATGLGAASPASPTASSACVVVLECPSFSQTVVPEADGSFVIRDVPSGACSVRVAEAGQAEFSAQPASSSSSSSRSAVVSPRDAASGLPTGKRQHKPMTFSLSLDGLPDSSRTQAIDDWSSKPVRVEMRGKAHELRGHVTLMK